VFGERRPESHTLARDFVDERLDGENRLPLGPAAHRPLVHPRVWPVLTIEI
jgi:hypothetical protein